MKISKHDQKLILILLGLAIFLASYFGICTSFNKRKAEVITQISEMQAQVNQLNAYLANESTYRSEIDRISGSISAELAKYPGDVRSEDLILYATELQDKIGMDIASISISSPTVISTFPVPEQTDGSFQLVPIATVQTALTLQCSMSYEQLKKLINYVYSSTDKTDIASIAVNYNEEDGVLIGSVTIEKYFITSADYTYSPTKIPSVSKGTEDPFGTFSTPASPTPSPAPTT